MKSLLSALTLSFLAGCAAQREVPPAVTAQANEPLYCSSEQQCRIYWQRAQVWISNNSRWKIQTLSDSLIVTFTPRDGSIDRAYKAMKVPVSTERAQILLATGCANMFGCRPHQDAAIASFKAFVKAAQ